MRFVVSCQCVGVIAEYPDRAGADSLVHRHHMAVGHTAVVERVLDTPFEGLLQ